MKETMREWIMPNQQSKTETRAAIGSIHLVFRCPIVMSLVWIMAAPFVIHFLGYDKAACLIMGILVGAWGWWGCSMMQNTERSDRRQ
jgi:uncharacterized membrane protein